VPSATITGSVAVVPPGWTGAIGASLALAIGLAVLLSRRRSIWQTTLVAAWWWTLAAVAAWSLVEIAGALAWPFADQNLIAALRFAAVGLTFCPVVALIGAKRPQHVAWNFVVVALWAIVALPAAEAFFLHGQRIQVGAARGCFLWVLVFLTPINFVPTRYWLPSLLVAAGQILALSPQLHVVGQNTALSYVRLIAPLPLLGLGICGLGLLVAWGLSRRERKIAHVYDRLWLDFRDTFGLFWALRVQERLNALAQQHGWDLELTWSGFRPRTGDDPLTAIDPSVEPTLRTSLKGLLRRFVSSDWIAARLGSPSD
jgi:hypothetical protein